MQPDFQFICSDPIGPHAAKPKLVPFEPTPNNPFANGAQLHTELKTYSYTYSLTKTAQEYFEKEGYYFHWPRRADKHPHGCCDVQRALCELDMHRLISENAVSAQYTVAEVGGNMLRTEAVIRQSGLSSRVRMRYLIPNHCPGDEKRWMSRRQRSVCRHDWQECSCAQADVVIGTHVGYYFTPDEFAQCLEKTSKSLTAWMIVHRIDDAYGSICDGELKWRLWDDRKVRAEASKNGHSYTHPLNSWMFQSPVATCRGPLFITQVKQVCETYILKFELSTKDAFIPTRLPTTWEAVLRNQSSGDITNLLSGPGKTPATEIIPLMRYSPSTTCHSICGVIFVDTREQSSVIIPKGLIETLGTHAVFQERTPTLHRTLVATATRILRASGCPAEIMAEAVIHASILAMYRHLEKETALAGRSVDAHRALITAHSKAIDFKGIEKDTFCRRWMIWCRPKSWAPDFESEEAREFQTTEQEIASLCRARVKPQLTTPTPVGGLAFEPRTEFRQPAPEPMTPGSKITIGVNQRKVSMRPDMKPAGIVFGDYVPTRVAKNVDAAVLALTQRILRVPIADPEPGAWAEVERWREDPSSGYGLDIGAPFVLTKSACAVWASRFPESRRTKILNAWDSVQRHGLHKADMVVTMIIKSEKGAPLTDNKATVPRGVYCNKEQALAIAGPVMSHIGKRIRANFSLFDRRPLIWANGCTGEELGAWTDDVMDSHPDWVCLVADQTKFESARTQGSSDAWVRISRQFCDDEFYREYVDLSQNVRIKNYAQDVQADTKYKLSSGRAETSVQTVLDNLAGVRKALGEPNTSPYHFTDPDAISTASYCAMVNGDDDLIFMPPNFITTEEWDNAQKTLGFDAPAKIVPFYNSEFCRCRPWPSSRGTIWGVMIGRTLSRLGWYIDSGNIIDPNAIALGLQGGNNHVPFVRLLLKKMIEIARPKVAAPTNEWSLRSGEAAEPSGATYDMLYQVYGLTKQDEEDFAILLESVHTLPSMITWGHLDHCMEIDE